MGVPGKVVGVVSEWEATMMIGGGHHEYQKLLAQYKTGGDMSDRAQRPGCFLTSVLPIALILSLIAALA